MVFIPKEILRLRILKFPAHSVHKPLKGIIFLQKDGDFSVKSGVQKCDSIGLTANEMPKMTGSTL